jgi:O-antigen/teichoic acid export membrane protein
MRRLVEAAAASGLASAVATLTGFVRIKLYALLLGVAGVGVISQVQNLHNLLSVVAMMGLGFGIARQVARARGAGEAEAVQSVLATARVLTGGASFVLVAAVLLLADPLSTWLLGDPRYAVLLRISAPALAFAALGRMLHEVLNGHGAYWATSLSTLISSVLGVALLAPLMLWLGLEGAAAALPAAAFVAWLAVVLMLRKTRPELTHAAPGAAAATARILLRLGAATLAIATADQVALLLIRAQLIRWHGLAANGWFQGVWGLSQYLLNVTVVFLSSYAVASISELGQRCERHEELHRSLRMTLLLTVPMAAGMILLREPLVRVFLSEEFLPAVPFFPYQAGGILCRAVGLALGIGLLASEPARGWLLLGLSAPFVFLATFWLLAGSHEVLAAPVAYLVSGLVYVVLAAVLCRRHLHLHLRTRELRILLAAAVLLVVLVKIADASPRSYVLGTGLLLGWFAVSVRLDEVRKAWALLRRPGL